MVFKWVLVLAAILWLPAGANAAQKAAIFPFEIDYQPSEDDFTIGEQKASAAEEARLKMVHAEFQKLLTSDGRYEAVDLSGMNSEIQAAQPLYNCIECDVDLAKKAGAEIAITVILDKISETHLNMIVTIRDVTTGGLLRNAQALVQGNTDETWLHGARWLLKNRLLVEVKTK